MSRNRCSSMSSFNKLTDEEIKELVLKLQALLPLLDQTPRKTTVLSATTIIEETCSYIKRLSREVDSLSERLSQLLDTSDVDDALIRTILNS